MENVWIDCAISQGDTTISLVIDPVLNLVPHIILHDQEGPCWEFDLFLDNPVRQIHHSISEER